MIASTSADSTLRDIVAQDFRAASVLERYGLDFCCKGGRSLAAACGDRGLQADAVLADLAKACSADQPEPPNFESWDADTLIGYIVGHHHAYVRAAIPGLLAHTDKIARVHGERHPELLEIARLFETVAEEMTSHMWKEEQILFPLLSRGRGAMARAPIAVMQMEHEQHGDSLARMCRLTNDITLPSGACNTWRALYSALNQFRNDLMDHIHLENNILFASATELSNA